jgi:hypothetical protein
MPEHQPADKQPLDEVMLAMDVVDTLRHRQQLVERELKEEGREQALLARLREVYTAQGIEVPDRVLAEGVAALREKRFQYQPPAPSLAVRLAHFYVERDRWAKAVLAVAVILTVVVIAYQGFQTYQASRQQARAAEGQAAWNEILRADLDSETRAIGDTIHERLQTALQQGDSGGVHTYAEQLVELRALRAEQAAVNAEAKVKEATLRATQLYADGLAALRAGDPQKLKIAQTALQSLQTQIEQEYVLQIVSRPGEPSGVWRTPAQNPQARNYYLIVEAVTPAGTVLTLPVTNEEGGKTVDVSRWGMRVSEPIFERVRADKEDDGIIQNRRLGVKRRGYLEPEYLIPVAGGAITNW